MVLCHESICLFLWRMERLLGWLAKKVAHDVILGNFIEASIPILTNNQKIFCIYFLLCEYFFDFRTQFIF
ncbi:hypothetical protein BGP_2607 [Beggiatoa sp. PS]|nr:hypothetical protein BGP_2607 [Beggiatoa sp. PS]